MEGANPPTARAPQARGLLRAQQLLDAAVALFLERGFDATSIDDIAARAGVAKGTVYHHFDSKIAVLVALRDREVQRFNDRIVHALDRSRSREPKGLLRLWTEEAVAAYIAMGRLPEILFTTPHTAVQWSAGDHPFMERVVTLLQRGREEGVWRAADPDVIAHLLFRGLIGVVDDHLSRGVNPAACSAVMARLAVALTEPVGAD